MKRNTRKLKAASVLTTLILVGCSSSPTPSSRWLQYYALQPPAASADSFRLCINFGCTRQRQINIKHNELVPLQTIFSPATSSAAQERRRIARAIGLLEQITAPQLGTSYDLARNEFEFRRRSNQLDCIAETANTLIYLELIKQSGWLRFHKIVGSSHRGIFTLNAPHNSATIEDVADNKRYVVDSWFRANGEDAWIVPLSLWLKGANPDD